MSYDTEEDDVSIKMPVFAAAVAKAVEQKMAVMLAQDSLDGLDVKTILAMLRYADKMNVPLALLPREKAVSTPRNKP